MHPAPRILSLAVAGALVFAACDTGTDAPTGPSPSTPAATAAPTAAPSAEPTLSGTLTIYSGRSES
ncbi:MAG: hypothetical protein WEC14_07405, partial [Chloroflexota bacterium]